MIREIKPEKVPAFEWWLAPLDKLAAWIARRIGWWYCSTCDAMHGPRTVKYVAREGRYVVPVCSVGRDPKLGRWDALEREDG